MSEIVVVKGSLLEQDVEYIVNAANTMMRGGGGIDGIIHRLAGPKLLLELQKAATKGCARGEVVVTGAHQLKHKGILHTPGPIWRGGENGEADVLANSYRNCLMAADNLRAASIGFCSISTGAYGYPVEEAAAIAMQTTRTWLSTKSDTTLQMIIFAMTGDREFQAFTHALATVG